MLIDVWGGQNNRNITYTVHAHAHVHIERVAVIVPAVDTGCEKINSFSGYNLNEAR